MEQCSGNTPEWYYLSVVRIVPCLAELLILVGDSTTQHSSLKRTSVLITEGIQDRLHIRVDLDPSVGSRH